MREHNAQKLYHSITNVKDEFIEEAQTVKPKRVYSAILKWCVPAACLCLALGVGALTFSSRSNENGGHGGYNADGFWGSGDCTLLDAHREDFTPGLSSEEAAAFDGMPEVMKIYHTLPNNWYLAADLTDFSQALTAEPFYIIHGFVNYQADGSDGEAQDGAYGVYKLDENGRPRWGMGVSAPANNIVPYELCRLTYDIIEEDLAGVDYEDYIITQSTLLYTVFVWARCPDGEDVFVTYPARPEFVGLENRKQYTLTEIQQILTEAFLHAH